MRHPKSWIFAAVLVTILATPAHAAHAAPQRSPDDSPFTRIIRFIGHVLRTLDDNISIPKP